MAVNLNDVYSGLQKKIHSFFSSEKDYYNNSLESFDTYVARQEQSVLKACKQFAGECEEGLKLILDHFEHKKNVEALKRIIAYTESWNHVTKGAPLPVLDGDLCEEIYLLAISKIKQKDFPHALEILKALLLFDSGYSATWIMTGAVLNCLGKHREALDALNIALQLEPDSSLAHYHSGCVHKAMRHRQLALDDFQIALRLSRESDPELVKLIERELK